MMPARGGGREGCAPAAAGFDLRLKSGPASRNTQGVTLTRPPTSTTRGAPRAMGLLLTLAALGSGCSTLAHKHVAAHGPHALADTPGDAEAEGADEAADDPRRRRLLVMVVEGLRQGVLTDYLERLDDADDEPEWPSGLAVLRQGGFRFAVAGQAETSVPGGGLAAAATWATGQWPAAHRIPGEVFYEARPGGQLLRYAFDAPLDAARIQYAPGLGWPSTARPTLAGALLAERTWAARLAPTHRVAITFAPFGHEAEWLLPEPSDLGAASRLPTAYAAAASPLFDQESADGALEMLLRDEVDVVVAWFRSIGVESCAQPDPDCGGGGGLNAIQARALQGLDGRLGEVLTRYQIAQPGAFARTSVLLVGTGSGIDRGDAIDNAKVMPPETLLDRIVERASEACIPRLTAARARGDLVVAAGGSSVARVYVRPAPLGQRARVRDDLACLGPALEALLDGSPWMSAVAHLPAERMGEAGPRAERFALRLRDDFEQKLSARRRSRLRARIRRSIDDGPAPRAGDAVVFASSGWIFADPTGRLLPDAALGGLTDVAMAMPFLIADRALSDVAGGGLRSTTVELADVAPTILAMAEAPDKAFAGLPRPPVVRWRGDALEHVRADRRIRAPERPERPSASFTEGPEGLTAGLDESTELWPADVVALRIGEAVFRWDPDANAFPEGLPCTYTEADGRRRWRCTAPVDRRGPGLTLVAVQRDPSGDDDVDGPLTRIEPVVVGASKPFLGDARVECVTGSGLRVAMQARDPLGLGEAHVFLVDDRVGADDRISGGLSASVELGRVEPVAACAADPFGPACAVAPSAAEVAGVVELPFAPDLVAHHAAAMALPGVTPVDGRALRQAWSDAGDPGTAPEQAWLALKVCNVAGQCVRRALISDVDLRAAPACP